ncbi:hypothetical protein CAPTEDRAFT_225952 [Capitella teleta]|uniref:Lipoxygenase homology domain-containing protein 1 n=1 Tax=Capitella teleta TaxID=283909 RepID=R7U4L2_CAPTE|nr:hypothetical protein CAPTEDRAFT_225952 [Capitella teleta]|eukprot:ELT98105.1 hypothetical protein CAPTEDRAFT_225952 [Capitella teleta]
MSSMADTPRGANGYPDDSEDSAGTDYKPHSYVGGTSMDDQATRQHLYDNPRTKMCFFYKDGEVHQKALKLVINQRRYRDLDILKNELTDKVPDLPFGVRSIYTPHGRTLITSLEDLEDSGNYICSTHRNKARGVDLARVTKRTPWQQGHPSSKHLLNRYLRHRDGKTQKPPPRKKAWGQQPQDSEHLYGTRVPKKITVLKNGEPHVRHTILLNRKTSQSFEQVIEDMCQIFQMQIRKLYTIEGRPVHSLSSIFNGPDIYVVTGGDRYKPMTAMSEPTPLPKRRRFEAQPTHKRNREKKDTSSHPNPWPWYTLYEGEWKVWVTTNELPSAGTQAHVSITVYGNKGNSGPLPLTFGDSEIGTFQAGSVDEFDICAGNIGDIYKIRIGHDNSGEFPGWFCDEVRMEDINTGEELKFRCQRWMSRDEDDHEICRELPVIRNREPVRPVMDYDIQVVTGDLWNAGTEANVYVTIYGKYGDTGVRQLYHPSLRKFHMGQSDHFHLEAVHLGQLQRVIVGHDGVGVGSGWFLDKIIIKESVSSTKEAVFLCRRWLDEGEDDGKIVRELKPLEEYNRDLIEKEMFEPERWKYQTGNQIILYPQSTQRPLRIRPDASIDCTVDHHDPDAVFVVNSTKRDLVKVFQSKKNHHYHLAIENNKLLGQGKGGSFSEFKIKVQEDRSVCFESTKYIGQHLAILSNGRPGNPRGQATDPSKQFYVYCKGTLRQEGIILFHSSAAHGQVMNINEDNSLSATGRNNKLAHFRVHKVDRGGVRMFESMAYPRQFLRIKDGQVDVNGKGGTYCHFHVDRVKEKGYLTLESVSSRGIFVGMSPEGKIRPTVNTGDKNVRLFPEVIHFGRSVTPEPEKKTPRKVRRRSPSPVTPQPRKRSPIRSASSTLSSAESFYEDGEWKLWVTSAESAENADVAVVVYGDQGSSGRIILGKAKDSELFRAGNVDEFKVNLESVGTIYKIRMELQAASRKRKPSWKVKEVKMQAMKSRETLRFKFNRWMSELHDDGDIMRELPAVRPKKRTIPVVHYQVYVYTGSQPSADTEANVCIVLFGERGDTGRRFLLRSDQENKFLEGQCDRFELEAVSLGRLTRCVISHDGEGSGEGWFCEKVVVKETERASEEYIFPCNKWLDAGIDDKKIERVLKVSGKVKPRTPAPVEQKQNYYSERDNEERQHSACSASSGRSLVSRYEKEKTLESIYGSAKSRNRRGRSCDSYRNSKSASHRATSVDSYHHRVDINNRRSAKRARRKSKDGLDDDDSWIPEDDGDYDSEFSSSSESNPASPTYSGYSRDARALIPVPNSGHVAAKSDLCMSHHDVSTSPLIGRLDFYLFFSYLSPLTLSELAEKAVMVRPNVVNAEMNTVDDSKTFCDMGTSPIPEEHHAIPITRKPKSPKPKEEKPKDGEWIIWVTTGRHDNMSTKTHVTLVGYGSRDKSEELPLGDENDGLLFQKSQTDEFKVNLGSSRKIGELYKIRIGRNDLDTSSGWFIEKIKMKNLFSDEVLNFRVNRWLSRGEEDCDVWRELPVVRPGKKPLPIFMYRVEVYTGNQPGADTEASVHIQLIGSRGDSGKRLLYKSLNNDMKFCEGAIDIFELECVSLREVKQVLIGHDDSSKGAGWFCEKVIVREGEEADSKVFFFPCGQWLDSGMDDSKIERILDAAEPPKQSSENTDGGEYKVWVKTKKDSKPPKGSKVTLTVYAERGKSKDVELGQEKGSFEAGREDEFDIAIGDLGQPYKIRIGRKENDRWEGWHLLSVRMLDVDTREEFLFKFDRWMHRSKDDFDIVRELPVTKEGSESLPVKKYEVKVYTGDRWAAGTDADIFVTIYGSKGDSGQRRLFRSSEEHERMFQRNQVDTFTIEAVSLEDLRKITLKHASQGFGAGVFVEKVVVREAESNEKDKEVVFPCNRWLDDHMDDQATHRDLFPSVIQPQGTPSYKAPKKGTKTQGVWSVMVKTGDVLNAGTHAVVHITACGSKGDSAKLELRGKSADDFDRDKKSEFEVNFGDIGEIRKIRIEHDNSNDFPDWFLQRVSHAPSGGELVIRHEFIQICIEDKHTKESSAFEVNRWLSTDEDDRQLCREMAVCRGEDVPPVISYLVMVFTSDGQDCSTEANVHVLLSGHHGNTGWRPLTESRVHNIKWLSKQMDLFTFDAVHLGDLQSIKLKHDGTDQDSAWNVNKVIIKETEHALMEYVFACDTWIQPADDGKENIAEFFCSGQTLASPLPEKESILLKSESESKGHWTVWLHTHPESDPAFKADVSIVVCGTDDSSQVIPLKDEEGDEFDARSPNKIVKSRKTAAQPPAVHFSPGSKDEFKVASKLFKIKAGKIGELIKIRLLVDPSGQNPSLLLSRLKMKDTDTQQEFHFTVDRWLKAKSSDSKEDIVLELPAVRPDVAPMSDVTYHVSVKTGSEFGSDTKADVFCLIKGEFGDTGRRPLLRSDKGADSFTLSQVDTYDLHAIDIGKVKQLTLGHTKYGRGRGWFCERATLRIGNSTEESVFPCHKWFDSALDDHLMERVLRPIGILPSPTNESPSGAYKAFAKTGAHSNYNTNSNNNNSIDNDNIDWLNCNNNNGSDPDRRQICVYAYGEKGSAGPIPLDNGDEDLFAPGKEEEFDLNVGDIGKIYKLRVCDGNSSYNRQPWILSELMLQDVHSKQTLKFDFSVFMGEIEGDHCKEIPALHADGDMLPVLTYGISILIGSNEETEKEKKENKKKKKKKGAEKEKHDISLCLHGTRGDSGFRQMIEIRKDLAEFTLGEAKEFSIRAVDLDKVHKVTVRKHSSNDLDLKEVAVKCGEFASMQDVFAYDQVIKGDVDVEIVLSEKREVKKSEEEEEEEAVWPISRLYLHLITFEFISISFDVGGRWEVTVITGKDKQDCDLVPATPALILIGSKGQSSPCPLKAQDASLQPFQPGATDKFRIRIKAEEVGEIKKVKVGFLKGRQNTRWFLQKIHFDDLDSGDSFSIEHGDWIDHESGWTLLLVKWPGMDDLSATAVHYIDVHTSSLPNASTDEPVFVQLHGKNKNKKVMSERIFLTKSNCTSSNSKLFMEGQSDQFMIESIEFETVERVFMGHESKVKGAGWHLDKVIVRNGKRPDIGHEFPCQRWFDVSQDDASTQRFLMPAESKALTPVPAVIPDVPPEEEEKEEGIWTVQVTTSKAKDAGHSAQVVMVIYGTKGKSAEFVLDNGQKNYQKGETDKFEVKIAEEVGQVYKIRIGFVDGTALNTKWQLDKVILRCEDTTDNYEFVYNEWVTLNAESDSWTEIAVKSDREQLEVKSYEVLVYTGMHANAGTDASVCAEIIGTRGDTGRRKLLKSSEEGKMFLQGKVDVFSIRAVDLEEIAKVVISHDAKVKGDGWFLDRVVVREKGKEFLFPCERWLDAGEDDGETERVLELKEKDEPPEYFWKVSTRTSKGKTKTDTFQVLIVIYGKKGKTEQLELDNGKKGNFQPSKTDLFQVKTSKDVGEVYKIRVGFLETKNGLVWNLDENLLQIELQNIVCGEKYKFSHKAVMQCTALSDGQIEIPVTLKDGILPVLCYEVLVHTADCEHAETQAEAFVEIQGERGDTGRRKLMKQGEKFTRGRVDAFEFLAVDLLTLTKVTIGHDCQEKGAGWCVYKVQVKCNQGEFHFPCNRWLDAGQDDGMVERTLDVEEKTWRVSVKSGLYSDNPKSSDGSSPANQGVPPAPPTGDLVMFIYGEEGNTEELHLTASNPPQYKPNSCDEFEVKFPRTLNLGALYKIRIGFKEGTTDDQNWNVVSVELQAENSERVHTFNLNGWLKLDHENDGWREIPVTLPTPLKEEKKTKKNGKKAEEKENIVLLLPVHNYQVEVHTGKMEDAGTRSGVYLKMQGKHGDSGSRKLLKALNTRPDVQFASGEISLFEVEAVDLQDLTSITVGHDNTDGGWNLHKIVVKPSAEAEQRYVFMCHRWFDVEKEDSLIERTIDVLKPGEEWKIRVSTGKEEGSSCSGPLLIVLYGDKGVSEIIEVGTDETVFENKRSQDFDVTVYPEKTTDEIGNPYKIRLGLKEREGDCMWHFDQLVAERVSDAEEFHFKGDVWIRLGEDSDSWREFPSWYENPDKVLPVIAYQIEVFTADKTGAGTDANVYVQLFGERGDTGKRKMLKSREEGNKFESGKKDIFEIEAVDLMELTRVVVGHDGKGFGAGWYLDKVAVKPGEDAENKYVFNCGRWLDKGEDDAKIERELEITQVIDGDEDPPEEGDWRILIMTSDKNNAGTDAQVTLTVFGVNGDSGPLPLGEPGGGFFEAAATDQFDIWLEPEEVGKVRKIRIEHDNRHEGCGWHLNKILFEDKFVGTLVEFPVDRWLDEDEDDGDIVREIPAVYSGEDPLPVTKYQVKTVTGDKRGAGTDAKVYVNLIGKNGDSGKRPLNISQRSSNKFESGKTDEFSLEAVDLGEIEKLVVSHNGTGVGSGWYLEEVIVVCEGEEMVFPCHNWLDEREGDGLLERELVKGKK